MKIVKLVALGIVILLIVWFVQYSMKQKALKAGSQTKTISDGVLQYQSNDQLFSVEKKTVKVLDLVSSSVLASNSAECGTNLSEAYFSGLLADYGPNSLGTQYHFVYNGVSQDDGYTVTVLPNMLGYTDSVTFSKDFSQCFAGGDLYPVELSKGYLMFDSSTGTGFDDSSGLLHGGELIEQSIFQSLRLVEEYDYIQ